MLGSKIRDIRKSKGLSINKVSKASGVSLGYLSDLENNKSKNPSMDTLKKIATVLEVSVNDFFSNEDNKNEMLTIKEQEKLDKEAQDLVNELTLSLSKNKEYLADEDYFAIQTAIRSTLETIKLKNKEKYTPKKYKKNK